jgi:hypothetical protein
MRRSVVLGATGRGKPPVWRNGAKAPALRQRFVIKREDRRDLQERLQVPREESEGHLYELALIRATPVPKTPSGRLANV